MVLAYIYFINCQIPFQVKKNPFNVNGSGIKHVWKKEINGKPGFLRYEPGFSKGINLVKNKNSPGLSTEGGNHLTRQVS